MPITSWTSGWEETSFFKGKLSCYPTQCSFSPSALAHSPLSIQPNVVYILPHTGFSGGGECQEAGSDTGGNHAFFSLKLQFSSSKTLPTVQRKLWLCKMDGHITPSFAIGYNLRSSSPGKFLPPPSPANVFPLSK